MQLQEALDRLNACESELKQLRRTHNEVRHQAQERSAAAAELDAVNADLEAELREALAIKEEQAGRIAVMQKALRDAQEFNRAQEAQLDREVRLPADLGTREQDDVDELQAFLSSPLTAAAESSPSASTGTSTPLPPEAIRFLDAVWQEVRAVLGAMSEEVQIRVRGALQEGISKGAQISSGFCPLVAGIEAWRLAEHVSWEWDDAELIVRLEKSQLGLLSTGDAAGVADEWVSPWGVWLEACIVGTGQRNAELVAVERGEDFELLVFQGIQPEAVASSLSPEDASGDDGLRGAMLSPLMSGVAISDDSSLSVEARQDSSSGEDPFGTESGSLASDEDEPYDEDAYFPGLFPSEELESGLHFGLGPPVAAGRGDKSDPDAEGVTDDVSSLADAPEDRTKPAGEVSDQTAGLTADSDLNNNT